MRRSLSGLGRLLPILALGVPALAQGTQTANISGQVVDKTGAVVPGARVRLSSPALQGVREVLSDDAGRFAARLLPPGEYKIQVSKNGMETISLTQRVGLEQTFSPHIVMQTTGGAIVEVVATAVAADKAEFKQAVNYTKESIDALPVSRSNLLDIAYLAPGVVENASSARGGVSIRGSMGSGNLFLVDGQNVQDNLYNGQRIPIIFDTVEETQVLTGALPAEYGDVEGGVVNSITKSGGDEFTAAIRFDLSNLSWNAAKRYQDRATLTNKSLTERSIQVDGPIIKSKLWFHAGGFYSDPSSNMTAGAGSLAIGAPNDGNGFGYIRSEKDYRREFKLTWAVNQNHTLSLAYHNNDKNTGNQDYGAGDADSFTALHTKGEFWNLQLRSILSQNATLSVKLGEKKQLLEGGGYMDPNIFQLYSLDDGLAYRNGYFDGKDPQPDHRDNQTGNIKLSYFVNMAGNHQFDAGFDFYHGSTVASGASSPNYFTIDGIRYNNYGLNVYGLDLASGTASVDSIDGLEFRDDKAEVTSTGYYVNDRWELNHHWNFQIGFRADHYEAKSKLGGKTSAATSFSPRLGAKFDALGDGVWTFSASYAKYNGRVLESTLQNVTYVNNAILKEFPWSPGGSYYDENPVSYATMQDISNYDHNYVSLTDAHFNLRIDPNLKPQQVAEWQLSATKTFNGSLGNGFLRVNWVSKDWSNLIDYTQGNSGTVSDPILGDTYVRVYQNSSLPTRTYKSLELEGQWALGPVSIGGNITQAKLEGNFVGEGAASPGRGQGLEYYTVQDGVPMYDRNITNPTGRLPGDKPLRARILGSYALSSFLGKTTFGLLFRSDSGDVYSNVRTVRRSSLNADLSSQFGSRATQYLDNTRGDGRFPSYRYLDFSIQQDFTLAKLKGDRSLTAFFKVDINNLFNQQNQMSYDVTYESLSSGESLATPFVPGSNFGKGEGESYYGNARTVRLSMGLKF